MEGKEVTHFTYDSKHQRVFLYHGKHLLVFIGGVTKLERMGDGGWRAYQGDGLSFTSFYAERRHLPGDLTVPDVEEEEEGEEVSEALSKPRYVLPSGGIGYIAPYPKGSGREK